MECRRIEKGEEGVVVATLGAPRTAIVAPAGYYLQYSSVDEDSTCMNHASLLNAFIYTSGFI